MSRESCPTFCEHSISTYRDLEDCPGAASTKCGASELIQYCAQFGFPYFSERRSRCLYDRIARKFIQGNVTSFHKRGPHGGSSQ